MWADSDFSRVVTASIYRAYLSDGADTQSRMSACLRWLRGEYTTKTEARAELGFPVSVIIDDDNWLRLFEAVGGAVAAHRLSGTHGVY